MSHLYKIRKKIALGLLLILISNILAPALTYALTSGPTEPETQGFQPAGVSDMVNLADGSFKYNIPLLDIDGYPINLSYASGVGIDDEASWVGLGWSLNPGAINRQVRGLPDDFAGDTVENDHYVKPNVTVGGTAFFKYEIKGINVAASGTVSVGLFNNNYTGIGADIGANPGISFSLLNDGAMTANLGMGVSSSTQSGVSLTPSVNLSIADKITNDLTTRAGFGASLGYNTRSGLKSLTLASSFGADVRGTSSIHYKDQGTDHMNDINDGGNESYDAEGSTISYNTEPISPSIQIPFSTTNETFSVNAGPAFFAQFPSFGGSGYQIVKKVQNMATIKPGYGFLYAERGKNNPDAVMDFIREKDNPIVTGIPNIALPINTPDVWTYTNQTGSGQFRLYRGGSGAFFDNQASDVSFDNTAGVDLGAGLYFHGGVTYFRQTTTNSTHKWKNNNAFLAKGDFQNASYTYPDSENVFFRMTGEKGLADSDINAQAYGTQPLGIKVNGMNANAAYYGTGGLNSSLSQLGLAKTKRRQNKTVISYLTAKEAAYAALDTAINIYSFNTSLSNAYTSEPVPAQQMHRVSAYRKPYHISELTVTDDGGKRMVYGIPVYNYTQDEYTFAVGTTGSGSTNNQVPVPANPAMNNQGIDNYYQREHKGAYATSYLLTAILSPDYVDKTGNGITDDDLGTAIKFNYSKLSKPYKWRSPYQEATLNRGLLADPDDDKGSVVYGEKEVWYVHSIESKTKIAYFITTARTDDYGVLNWQTGTMDTSNPQMCLKQIRLYSKADMSKPIKVVTFNYNYTLCPGLPNSSGAAGKLTLSSVYFTYGNSDKGQHFPYTFSYNTSANGVSNVGYNYMVTDRWGTYKPSTENTNGLTNEEYPYTDQNSTVTNQDVALWHLNQVNLPTGGQINISYESGDYAYVQNKIAMVMTGVASLINGAGTTVSPNTLNQARGITVNIGTTLVPPAGANQTQWFEDNFLNSSNYLYTKLYVHLAVPANSNPKGCLYDFVPCYAQISSVSVSGGVATILFQPITQSGVTTNPISIAAWQRLKNDYPRYAYPGFDNRVQLANNSVLAAVSAIINAAKNLSELTQNFYQKANANGYASIVNLTQSFVRIAKVDGHKLGGPARVNRITINDEWKTMSGNSTVSNQYGQAYTYTTVENGQTISSGVATYEPYIGGDENAIHEPVPYIENIKGAISNYFDIEKPFGESLYPAPEITYAKVTVQDLDQTGNPSTLTGSVVNEFYTSRDFPVKVNVLPIAAYQNRPASHYSLTSSTSNDNMSLSQGYSIELNDMNARQKAVRVLNQNGAEISSTVYNYNVDSTSSLNNHVSVVGQNGVVTPNQVLGQEVEFYTDFREQVSNNNGTAINIGGDIFPVGFFPFPFFLPHFPVGDNTDTKLFRSACAVKVIQTYGLLNNVVKTENGSAITTTNIAYDGLTGEPLVTQTQNEFNKTIYSVNIPAYWPYAGMGGAYKNQGVYLTGFNTNTHGEITNTYASYLRGGDELADSAGNHFWVIYNQAYSGTGMTKKLIARDGTVVRSYNSSKMLVKVVRSGFRNMLSASTSSVVCLNNPLVTTGGVTTLQLVNNTDLTSLKVINASATTYDESWAESSQSSQNIYTNNNLVETAPPHFDFLARHQDGCPGAYIRPNVGDTTSTKFVSSFWGKDTVNDEIYHTYPTGAVYRSSMISDDYHDSTSVVAGAGFDTCINIQQSQVYYIGYWGYEDFNAYIDGNNIAYINYNSGGGDYIDSFGPKAEGYWHVIPLYLSSGKHFLHVINTEYESSGVFGLEIYQNTAYEITHANDVGTGINIIFSTSNLIGKNNFQYIRVDYSSNIYYKYLNPDGSIPDLCNLNSETVGHVLNPYLNGFLGNWRPYQTKVYQQNRNDVSVTSIITTGANIKNAGYINNFYSYWYYGTGGWTTNTSAVNWISANEITLYDKYGQQLENLDALGRFSSAKFDFNGELSSAVTSNAMNREIYANSFEDNKIVNNSLDTLDTCSVREFIEPFTNLKISKLADSTYSHSGNYSAKLNPVGVTMSTIVYTTTQKTVPYLNIDTAKQYITKIDTGLYPNGFEPVPNKQYIFDAWIYDRTPNDMSINVSLFMNASNISLKCKANIEGWKLIEGIITIANLNNGTPITFSIVPNPGFTINIDDIRMHPFNAQMKTYAYDDKTMRLMAELDENAFATFYEYDDEGLLIRVKKETQKGIMTLKESRSSYKKDQ